MSGQKASRWLDAKVYPESPATRTFLAFGKRKVTGHSSLQCRAYDGLSGHYSISGCPDIRKTALLPNKMVLALTLADSTYDCRQDSKWRWADASNRLSTLRLPGRTRIGGDPNTHPR